MKIELILKEILEKNKLNRDEEKLLDSSLKEVVEVIRKNSKIDKKPEIFVGGSYAKKTMVRKDSYDIDLFLRFDKSYSDKDLSKLSEKIVGKIRGASKIHGSRDYFRVKVDDNIDIEIIPVIKINKINEARNITDLSYSHVKYINKKIKTDKILGDIKLAKVFCHANKCYGAESYIKGFSGYALELLVYYYGGFLKMIRALSKETKDKIIIDIEKDYKRKGDVLLDMNSSKIQSPIILVDPTYPQRNALAALSNETFERFKEACKDFLKKPSEKFFEPKKVDIDQIRKNALKKHKEFILLEVHTSKQEGDIAGSKLLKFYNHFSLEIGRFFDISNKGFNYNGKKSARYFFVVSKKKEIIYDGPLMGDEKNTKEFMKEHKNVYGKKGRLYAKEELGLSIEEFVKKWSHKNKRQVKEMSIEDIKII